MKEEDYLGTSPPAEAFGWTRDTLAVKKRLAQASGAFLPGRKVQAMGFEQSLAIQSAALLAERERERRTDELRAKPMPASREKSSLGVPSGAAHRLGRKSISSCSGSMRKHSMSGSASPPKAQRAGGPFARHADTAELEASESDTEDVDLYAANDDDDDAEVDPIPAHARGRGVQLRPHRGRVSIAPPSVSAMHRQEHSFQQHPPSSASLTTCLPHCTASPHA